MAAVMQVRAVSQPGRSLEQIHSNMVAKQTAVSLPHRLKLPAIALRSGQSASSCTSMTSAWAPWARRAAASGSTAPAVATSSCASCASRASSFGPRSGCSAAMGSTDCAEPASGGRAATVQCRQRLGGGGGGDGGGTRQACTPRTSCCGAYHERTHLRLLHAVRERSDAQELGRRVGAAFLAAGGQPS